ncbi:hypothetical protein BHM03_00035470 [Ensete ventricosum]|nr:hypothetical protein BHM03_00035470 [Ensete ventricosum]
MSRRPDRPEPSYPRPPLRPSNSTPTKIILQIKEKGLLRTPNPLKDPRELWDWAKYYRFYRAYGYDTKDYHNLHNQIEELIRTDTSGVMSGGPETHPYTRRGLLRSRSMLSSGVQRLEESAHRD